MLSQSSKRSAGSMGVPLGALLTPLPVGAPPPPLLPRRPTCCDRCRAFVNLYCRVSPSPGLQDSGVWTPPLNAAQWCCPRARIPW